MPSLVTSIIGGIQGASAAHNATNALQQGYNTAGQTVQNAVQQVNPEILAAAKAAGIDVTGAAQTAGQGAVTAGQAAGTGATTAAQQLYTLLSPYMQGGSRAMSDLTAALGPGGNLTQPFTASMMAQYSPAYAFQLKAGQDAMAAQAAAAGLSGSGGTAKSLGRYAMDYSTNAFATGANLYQQQQEATYNRLAGVAGLGQTAATTAGQAGLGAAEYAGTAGTQAAEYAGTLGTQAAQWTGGQNIGATNLTASNTLSGANYLANTQLEAQKALAQGDLGAAQAWNSMMGGIGQAGNTALFAGMSPTGGGWSFSNIGKNLFGGGKPAAGGGGGAWA
jgi:hypothetical protein